MTITIKLETLTAGELAALYILVMRGLQCFYTPSEIQDQLESLIGDLGAIVVIRNLRSAIDSQ